MSLKAYIIWDEKKALNESILYLKEALLVAPFWPMLHIELIYLFMNLGHFKEAQRQIEITAQLIQIPPKIPNNDVEEYYEKMITGRSWPDLANRLNNLRFKIENAPKPDLSYF